MIELGITIEENPKVEENKKIYQMMKQTKIVKLQVQ